MFGRVMLIAKKFPLYSSRTSLRPYTIRHCFWSSCSSSLSSGDIGDNEGENFENVMQILSLFHKNETNDRIIQQIHSRLVTAGFLLRQENDGRLLFFNSLLRCYSLGKSSLQAYSLYRQLQQLHFLSVIHGKLPPFDSFTFSFLLKASANSRIFELGIGIQGATMKLGFGSHVYVQTALVDFYVAAGNTVDAWKVFDGMPERNPVTWNAMIGGLINWGELERAVWLFETMPLRTVISWTIVIDGYVRMNVPEKAIHLFSRMVAYDRIKPNEISILAILPAVSNLGDIRACRLIHGYVEKRGFVLSAIRVANSLIDTYAKCGCIQSSFKFFSEIPEGRKDMVSWTSIISAFAMHGMGKEAIFTFKEMERFGLKPNGITLLSVLTACSHGGLAEDGLDVFNKTINKYQIKPDVKHYGCLVDMLGRSGRLEEAEKIALEIPTKDKDDIIIWRILLGACSFHGDAVMGERVTRKIMELERGYGGDYVLMSNILSSVGRFADAQKFRRLMDRRKAIKDPGHSQQAIAE
ncbi:PREDICTED: pentatricopeptide repeat-containing protein At1g09220, mitochondrial isoform X1 [Tarenaya hassleriana]|uniref:pentatricopeptide repeat-containing protein At1g09220, mitochondrial isoform X2 n=1 Tax=Tarenaya hassleriana TaxID=28532 RepID=UPI00053C540C|nr:PREDICTED: pentatricopeptide repeat-containing protein At1g09220, mitochondrial isoform X2 [Tarenaya hassleriana]XP_010544272.1 PREDICTED: pentatricopeptide repeat-containing protein At1g09220, mitochondrial isoform X1 [Tarenaya hassleriana]